jgi:phosphoglycolate phosphatase
MQSPALPHDHPAAAARNDLLVLWDIDGTLVRSHARVAVNAFMRALASVAELTSELAYPTDSGGKTDEQLALEVLVAAALDQDAAIDLLPRFRQAYAQEVQEQIEQLRADVRVLPGVPEALQAVQAAGCTQSLLTGNLEPIARLKLACAGLDHYFAFELGAYGSDHRDRTCLVPIARERVRAALGSEPAAVVVIGDTPRDIACARAGRARVIAVATGHYPAAELERHRPDAVLEDLRDTRAVLEALLGYSTSRHSAPIV